jgi:hypothetical protein
MTYGGAWRGKDRGRSQYNYIEGDGTFPPTDAAASNKRFGNPAIGAVPGATEGPGHVRAKASLSASRDTLFTVVRGRLSTNRTWRGFL